jgi:hypothetical protein
MGTPWEVPVPKKIISISRGSLIAIVLNKGGQWMWRVEAIPIASDSLFPK